MSIVRESPATPPGPAERRQRQQRTDDIIRELQRAEHGSSECDRLTEELIAVNVPMARNLASRYRNRGLDLDDLEQVAMVGLVKAARRFDVRAGFDFMSFAVPTVRGELRRHFRDFGWTIRPPRRIQEARAAITGAQDVLEQRLGRSARARELAAYLDVDVHEIKEALATDGHFAPASLDKTSGSSSTAIGDLLSGEDPAFDVADAVLVLAPVVRRIPARERRILQLRYYEQRSQREIADDMGLTQSSVSRILDRILRDLRSQLEGGGAAA